MSNAHEHAYQALKAAGKALEGPGIPTLADFKDARDLAKSAHETLDAAHKLLSKGIYHVIDGEDDSPSPLFTPEGDATPEATIPAPEETSSPDFSIPSLGFDPSRVQDAEIVDPENAEEATPVEPELDAVDDVEAAQFEGFLVQARQIVEEDGKITTKKLRDLLDIGDSQETAVKIFDALEAEGLIDSKGKARL